ncbi:MAG: pimeloyl-CoA dehydrogenase small subunit [Sphingomonadales bacterium]|nr:MAG: pimeloyl-CoA dehydrogenase small subunit [Sphingomonadales bacterium]
MLATARARSLSLQPSTCCQISGFSMAFALRDEQQMLLDTIDGYLKKEYDFDTRRAILSSPEGWSADVWRQLADLGMLGLPFAEEDGGMGLGALELAIVLRAIGGGLIVEPYLPTVVLAGGILRRVATADQRRRFVPAIASGEAIYVLAFAEPNGRFNLADITVSAVEVDGGYAVTGSKSLVLGAPIARGLFVTVRTAGARRDQYGISVVHVPADAPGVRMRTCKTVDGGQAADVDFDNVFVPHEDLLGVRDGALPGVEHVIDEATIAVTADMAGAMWALYERTLEYARIRSAFGKTLSQFQVIQHRLVDMRVACEYADAMVQLAAEQVDADPLRRAQACAAAKVQIGRDGRFVAQNAVQLHGAVGMTDELDVSHYFRRITVLDGLFGNPDHHLKRYAALLKHSAPSMEFAA